MQKELKVKSDDLFNKESANDSLKNLVELLNNEKIEISNFKKRIDEVVLTLEKELY